MYVVTVETLLPVQARHIRLHSYAHLLIWVGRTHSWRSYHGNLKNVCVCVCVCVCTCKFAYYTFTVVPVVGVETQIICVYVYYTLVLVPSDPLYNYFGNLI